MRLEKIHLRNFRNHEDTEVEFCKGINIIYGKNGSGKTSILESISVCGFSKTFLQVNDSALIKMGKSFFSTTAECKSDLGLPYRIKVEFLKSSKKKINSSLGDNLLPKDMIGEMPLVILSPDFKSITFGGPSDRRQFVDRLLSQTSKLYIENLLNIKRSLKQRNSLLSGAFKFGFDESWMQPWTNMLIEKGSEIALRRLKFVNEFKPYFKIAYKEIAKGKEAVDLEYLPDSLDMDELSKDISKEKVMELYERAHNKLREKEFKRGTTLFGPQKDELKVIINDGVAKEIASQGQHKTLLISIKFAEFRYLNDLNKETPIILLDDIFSELDENRARQALNMSITSGAQTFITVTEADMLRRILPNMEDIKYFLVEDSRVTPQN